jgi:hypothetical protein
MAEAPIDDALFGPTTIRKDGRAVHDMFLFQVKMPAERKARWDYYKVAATIRQLRRSPAQGRRVLARPLGKPDLAFRFAHSDRGRCKSVL